MFSDLSGEKRGPSLLREPVLEEQGPVFERSCSAFSGRSQRFSVGERSFSRQFAHIYAARLLQMRPLLSDTARHQWGEQDRGPGSGGGSSSSHAAAL